MKQLLTLERQFQSSRLTSAITIGSLLVITISATFLGFHYAEKFSKRIYIVNRGEAIEATCGDVTDNRLAEARYQIRKFHELFFSISPDQKSIDANIRKALYLCDESAYRLYLNLTEQDYYRQMIEGNVTQQVTVDSMRTDMASYPYHSVNYITLVQQRATARTTRKVITTADLVDVNRSENSPNGFLIRNFHIAQSTIVEQTNQ